MSNVRDAQMNLVQLFAQDSFAGLILSISRDSHVMSYER